MGNPNSSTFLGNVQWKLFKQLKNSDFHSIFHNATVTVNLFEILEMLPESVWHVQYSVSLNFSMGNPKPSTFLGNVQWKLVKQLRNSDFHSILHNETVTVNLFVIKYILPQMYLTWAIKSFPSIWIWPIHFCKCFSWN